MGLPLLLAGAGALFMGAKMVGKVFGSDPDFNNAWMINRMTGQGGFFKTFFEDGLKSMFLGSRTASAAFGSGYPMGMSLYGGPMGFSPYMMNPRMMGGMPYSPMNLGYRAWC